MSCSECESVIIVPERAIKEPGYIQLLTVKDSAHAKHEYHAMAQMAYFQYQDDELTITEVSSPVTIMRETEKIELSAGMVLFRDMAGTFSVMVHSGLHKKKLLETSYRYCTRWVRLDI